ncbi:class I SAM-dependent methyltransferase [Streptomyces niger]|uniref:class I SAM-dependent methyltransferase n=1 Tax=Streptomyces niger TaxID=66373 RepID=UPI000A89FA1C|nr:class I SAM-dependent methyltransferase [Streptomyces niger]
MNEAFDKAFWEERYRGQHGARVPRPNPQLVAEAAELAPGRALDAGCGEGADARWLAARGWRVTAVDIAAGALDRARQQAAAAGADVADRIEWREADLTAWVPPEGHFDLVSTHYVHPAGSPQELFRRLAAAVAPGGTLLVVGHDPSGHGTDGTHDAPGEVHFTAEEVAADLDPDRWDVLVAEARTRPAHGHGGHGDHDGHGGHGGTLQDSVLRARKRP